MLLAGTVLPALAIGRTTVGRLVLFSALAPEGAGVYRAECDPDYPASIALFGLLIAPLAGLVRAVSARIRRRGTAARRLH